MSILKITKHIVPLLIALSLLFICACGGNSGGGVNNDNSAVSSGDNENTGDNSGGETPAPLPSEPQFSDNVYSIDLCDEVTRKYLSATTEAEEYSIMRQYAGSMHDSQTETRIKIKSGKAPFEVAIADNADMLNAYSKTTATNTFIFGGTAIPGTTYYYEAKDADGNITERGTIKTKKEPVRMIDAPGGMNIRDMGGWSTESGNNVAYGLMYRGAQLNGYNGGATLSAAGIKVFRDELGIKTELDLRGTNDSAGQIGCYFGSDRNYRMISISQYDNALKGSRTQLKEIFELLSDKSNYPVYFHCNAGADRTGTVAFLLNGLLGVSESDLTKDFELTSFGGGKRLRSKDTGNGYDDSGVFQNDSSNYVAWGKAVGYIKDNYVKNEGETLADGIEKYLLAIGVPQNSLNKIKVNMLGLKTIDGGQNVSATCEKNGVNSYELGGKTFEVETPASGHEFTVENDKAKCNNCELSGDYVHLNADSSASLDIKEGLSLSSVSVADKFGKAVGEILSFSKTDAGEEKHFIVKTGDSTVIVGVSVWSKIIRTEQDIKRANNYSTKDAVTKTVKGYYLFDEDIALGNNFKEIDSIGYNDKGYVFSGLIDGNGKVLSGLDTENRAALVYAFGGEIKDLTIKGKATEEGAQFLCASSYGGKITNVEAEVELGEKSIEAANSAILGNIGENGEISEIFLKNITVIESSAIDKIANRKKSSALGKLYNEPDKQKLYIDGLTVVGIRPIITALFSDDDVAGEQTLKNFLGDHVKNVKIYRTVSSYKER